jgi:hypothetical protein
VASPNFAGALVYHPTFDGGKKPLGWISAFEVPAHMSNWVLIESRLPGSVKAEGNYPLTYRQGIITGGKAKSPSLGVPKPPGRGRPDSSVVG